MLDLLVDELSDLAEGDDVVEALLDLLLRHAEDRGIQVDVLATAELGVKTRTDLDEPRDPPLREHAPLVGLHDARHHLERRRLSGSVEAEHGDGLALADLEAHILESFEVVGAHLLPARPIDEPFLEGMGVALHEPLRHAVDDDRRGALGGLLQSVGHHTS